MKTVKTKKSDFWCKNPNKIQNGASTLGYWLASCGVPFKETTLKKDNFHNSL